MSAHPEAQAADDAAAKLAEAAKHPRVLD